MIRKVRKWVTKKPSSFEERMNAQPNTFDIIQTQYTTEYQQHPIEVLDHMPGDSDVVVHRNERFESIEIVSKDPADLSMEEQATLDFLNSAIEVEDDAFIEDETETEANQAEEQTIDEISDTGNRSTLGSKSSSQRDNWSLEARERSSGKFKMVQQTIYLPEANGINAIINVVTPDLPDPDYSGSESDSSEIENIPSPTIDAPQPSVTSQLDANDNILLQNNEVVDAEQTEKTPAKVLRGTSFNLLQGRSELRTVDEDRKNNKDDEIENVETTINGEIESEKDEQIKNDSNKEIKSKNPSNTNVNETATIKQESATKTVTNNKVHNKITAFSRYGDGNNNYPVVTSFKSKTDGDLKLLSRNKPVNNLVKKFETMSAS